MPPTPDPSFAQLLEERLRLLPRPVQEAIRGADIQKNLRSLADAHKLHLDQWQALENEVMLTLVGAAHVEDLEENIRKETGVTAEVALALANSISEHVFEPIREELERQLEHPDAQAVAQSDTEKASAQALNAEHAETVPTAPAIPPATPPAPAPEAKVARPTESSAYKPGEASHERASVHDDPYRESPV